MMISYVYLDVGGVALLDFSGTTAWEDLLVELGITDATRGTFDAIWDKHKDRVCIDFSMSDMLAELRSQIDLTVSDDYSLLDGFVRRFKQNRSMWPVVSEMSRSADIGLLTNMYVDMLDAVQTSGLLPTVTWADVVDSTKVGMQKPDTDIFIHATRLAGVSPQEILFVENTLEHIRAAEYLGWQTFHYDPADAQESSTQLLDYYRSNY